MALSSERIKEIRDALSRKGATGHCPVCQQGALDVTDTYAAFFLKDSFEPLDVPEDLVATVVMARCNMCGFLMLHDMRALGVV